MIRYKVGYMKYTIHPCFQHGLPSVSITGMITGTSSSMQNNLVATVMQTCRKPT